MRLLIADLLRRKNRWLVVFATAFLAITWGWLPEMGDPARAFAISMGAAFALGPQTSLWFMPREIWYLPIPRRDVWRASWLVATVGTTALTLAPKVLTLVRPAVRDTVGVSGVLLSTLYDFAATGIGCALVIVATRPPAPGPLRLPWPILKAMAEMALPLGMLTAVYAPMWLGLAPPSRWTDITPRGAMVLVAALALTIAGYFHTPVPPVPANRTAPPARSAARRRRADLVGVTGLPRLLLHEFSWTLMIGGALTLFSTAIVLVMASVVRAPADLIEFLATDLLLIDGQISLPAKAGFAAFNILIWYALFAATLMARFPSMVRHLRVLPLGSHRVHLLLLGWPALIWLSMWAARAVLHYAILGQGVASFRGDLLLALIGFSALVQSLTLRLTGVSRIFYFSMSVGVVPIVHFLIRPQPASLALAGLVSLATAAFLNHRSLSRTSTYKSAVSSQLSAFSNPV